MDRLMSKLTAAKPIRIDPATQANLEIIIASGIAKDTSAAFRAAAERRLPRRRRRPGTRPGE
jgi:hypothetical protein